MRQQPSRGSVTPTFCGRASTAVPDTTTSNCDMVIRRDRSSGTPDGAATSHSIPARRGSRIVNAFTVDVEDYFHVTGFADRIDPRQWDSYESRVVRNTHRILHLLDRYHVRATFFVLGWVADRFPQLVVDIRRSGHEIGCHGFWHRLIYDQTPDEFFDDLALGRQVLEEITGEPVVAYRAPSFSITKRSLWALEILAEERFRYDSSVFPTHHDRYGIPGAERYPHRLQTSAGSLWEFPPSVYSSRWHIQLPVAGGGYFRLYPFQVSARWLARINRRDGQPFLFYVHPWEIDPTQPRLPGSPLSRFRHCVNLGCTEAKLERLLSRFVFGSLTDSISRLDERLLFRKNVRQGCATSCQ